jgi:DNA-binding NtrC family response regulator
VSDNGKATILIVDDDQYVLAALMQLFCDDYNVILASSGAEAIEVVRMGKQISAVVMDIKMTPMDGLTAARHILTIDSTIPVIFHTGYPREYNEQQIDAAEKPFEYVQKGRSSQQLIRAVRNAVETSLLRRSTVELSRYAANNFDIIGRSPVMLEVYRLIRRVAPTEVKVMILGETGTGKELVARAIHKLSARKDNRLVIFNCNHKSADLVESELFGHVKGAFTGAISGRIGQFEYADGGTVFLDEIGDLDITTQAKLLRVVETGEFSRVGAHDVSVTNVRVICATHKSLEGLVSEGRFREDLYYRLKGVQILMPPLRERREDIPLLIGKFLDRFTIECDMPPKYFDPDAEAVLRKFDWPGNVRDLERAVESLIVLTDSDVIIVGDVQRYLHLIQDAVSDSSEGVIPLPVRVREFKRKCIEDALSQTGGNISEAARLLGVDRANLGRDIRALNIALASGSAS